LGWNGKSWTKYEGKGDEIAVGADGSVFKLKSTKIYKLDRINKKWISLKGNAIQITVGKSGKPYIINPNQIIFWPNEPSKTTQSGLMPVKENCQFDKADWLP